MSLYIFAGCEFHVSERGGKYVYRLGSDQSFIEVVLPSTSQVLSLIYDIPYETLVCWKTVGTEVQEWRGTDNQRTWDKARELLRAHGTEWKNVARGIVLR